MPPTLPARRDRTGHGLLPVAALLVFLLTPGMAVAAGPGNYKAQRFDAAATVVDGGLDVVETIVFEFQTGSFKRVWREIPAARTDGVEIVEAWMDGRTMPRGEGPGHVTVSGRSRIRIEWQFPDTGPSVHTFGLRYVARGVAFRQGDVDVVRWRLLPTEHRYRIDASRLTIAAPAAPVGTPAIESRRVENASIVRSEEAVAVMATGIGTNGGVTAEVHYPAGRLARTQPEWQQRQASASALAPRWLIGAGGLFLAGLLVLLTIRQGYSSPGFDEEGQATTTEPPENLPAALAAALAGKGRASGFSAVATLLDLADRGVITIRELPRRLGVRHYGLSQVPGKHDLSDHEAEALTIAFAGAGDDVPMSRARGRLARGGRRFTQAVNRDLEERGMLDPERKAVRDRLTAVSVAMLFTGGLGAIAVAPLIPRYQGWPFLLPLALAISGIVGVVMAAATTSLSDSGLMQSSRWRGFRRYLKDLADPRVERGAAVQPRWIVYGIALGLAPQWARYLRKHPDTAPPWFVAGTDEDPGGAFAAFVGSNAAHASGSGGAGGAAAGGGGSGAG